MVEGTRGIEFMSGIIISVVIANWVAHHIHHDGVYESELERIGNLYFLRDEPPHRYGLLRTTLVAASQPHGTPVVHWKEWRPGVVACAAGDAEGGLPMQAAEF